MELTNYYILLIVSVWCQNANFYYYFKNQKNLMPVIIYLKLNILSVKINKSEFY